MTLAKESLRDPVLMHACHSPMRKGRRSVQRRPASSMKDSSPQLQRTRKGVLVETWVMMMQSN